MSDSTGPLLTQEIAGALHAARASGHASLSCSLDLGRSKTTVGVGISAWSWNGNEYPFPERCRERTIYYWDSRDFVPAARFSGSLIKLVPTPWGPPTFEIDGIKMLPTAQVSPYADAGHKVDLIQPRGKTVLDTCGGLGYFAAWCLDGGAAHIQSFEKNPDVIWLRGLNPWSPDPDLADGRLTLTNADVSQAIAALPDASMDAILHDPPRFGIAGELYSQAFYDQLSRVLRPRGRLFHYTGTPNRLTSRRDVPAEVGARLQRAGFSTAPALDGVLAVKGPSRKRR